MANQTGLELQQLCVIYSGQSRLLEKLKCRCPMFEPRVYILLCVYWLTNTDMIHILVFFFSQLPALVRHELQFEETSLMAFG